VQPGDTLSSLARRYKMSVSELMKLNNLENPRVWPGQKIVVPAGRRAVAQRERTAPVASQASAGTASGGHVPPLGGQSQAASAPAQSVSAQAAATSSSDWRGSYTIGQGESLYGIARKHGVKVAELQRVNGITDVTKIRPGTVLKVPGGEAQPTSASSQARPVGEQVSALATPQDATSQLTVRPRIINGEAPPAKEPQRVAALEASARTANDATPGAIAARSEPAGGLPETPKLAGTGKFRWPVKGKIIAGFGFKSDKTHNDGINISVPQGTDVLAAESGVVAYAGNELKGYGNLILIRHEGGWVTAYAHSDELLVKRGDKVRRGQPIAKAGSTGAVDQPQVHFELRQDSKPVDPLPHMEK
jgi:murein DD-endopeptidase MepM/ murein hydrolase activator NlpD